MKREDLRNHFGTYTEVAKALGLRTENVSRWGDDIPLERQLELERITGGALRASRDAFPRLARPLRDVMDKGWAAMRDTRGAPPQAIKGQRKEVKRAPAQ